jgi:hypothetical protein
MKNALEKNLFTKKTALNIVQEFEIINIQEVIFMKK